MILALLFPSVFAFILGPLSWILEPGPWLLFPPLSFQLAYSGENAM
jgi:hypothetical protein